MNNQKASPILFSTEMTKAILENRKTQTRRPVKSIDGIGEFNAEHDYPKYNVGDILYVREAWANLNGHVKHEALEPAYIYRADSPVITYKPSLLQPSRWRPSIHMPKEAARVFLQIAEVGVQRIQDIDVVSCVREGASTGVSWVVDAKPNFIKLWDSIYADSDYAWTSNPWVWVYTFKRIAKPDTIIII